MSDDDDTANVTDVRDDPEANRYAVTVAGKLVGLARYSRRGGRTIFTHTEVDPELEGQGVASALIAGALDAERAAGRPVVPICPFVAAYIERHQEYANLVDQQLLAQIDDA
ncbi:GNAT family N-acetyltransferase [soil metagenome]